MIAVTWQGYVLGTLEGDGLSFDTLGECITYHSKYDHVENQICTNALTRFAA